MNVVTQQNVQWISQKCTQTLLHFDTVSENPFYSLSILMFQFNLHKFSKVTGRVESMLPNYVVEIQANGRERQILNELKVFGDDINWYCH